MTRTRFFHRLLLCLAFTALPVQAEVFSPYKAVYEVNRGSIMLGDTTFSMQPAEKNCFHIKGIAEPMGLAALFAGKTTEESHFCLENGHIRSQKYRLEREGGDEDDSYTLRFDWGNQLVTTDKGESRELPAEGFDRTVMELALRRQLARHFKKSQSLPDKPFIFLMVEDDEIKPYRFQVTGRETINTAAGRFDTLRIERVNSDKRQFRLWLAPELDYLPVRLERQRKDKPIISMTLRNLPLSPTASKAEAEKN